MPIRRGTYYSKSLQYKARSTGQPVDISTWQFEANLLDETGATALEMSTGGGHFTVFDGENGWLRWALSVAETEALAAGPVTFELYRTDASEGRRYILWASDLVKDQE